MLAALSAPSLTRTHAYAATSKMKPSQYSMPRLKTVQHRELGLVVISSHLPSVSLVRSKYNHYFKWSIPVHQLP